MVDRKCVCFRLTVSTLEWVGYGRKAVGALRAAVPLSNHPEGPPGGANLQRKLITHDSPDPITLILNEKKKRT